MSREMFSWQPYVLPAKGGEGDRSLEAQLPALRLISVCAHEQHPFSSRARRASPGVMRSTSVMVLLLPSAWLCGRHPLMKQQPCPDSVSLA
jgi:hypothetical protein